MKKKVYMQPRKKKVLVIALFKLSQQIRTFFKVHKTNWRHSKGDKKPLLKFTFDSVIVDDESVSV